MVVQFSRGCPHPCSYCGQRGFWTRWRHRDPVRFAAELARLHREHGIRVVNTSPTRTRPPRRRPGAPSWRPWSPRCRPDPRRLDPGRRHRPRRRSPAPLPQGRLAALPPRAREHRCRDPGADPQGRRDCHRPGGDPPAARERHPVDGDLGGGFEEERDADHWRGLRQLLSYDPDQIQMLYVTPHRWTPLFPPRRRGAPVIQTDRRLLDYKHQVLATRHLPPWRVLLWVKLAELVLQARPKALARTLLHPIRPCAMPCAGTPGWAAGSGSTRSGGSFSATGGWRRGRAWRRSGGCAAGYEEEAMRVGRRVKVVRCQST